jgi:hypothetical protein
MENGTSNAAPSRQPLHCVGIGKLSLSDIFDTLEDKGLSFCCRRAVNHNFCAITMVFVSPPLAFRIERRHDDRT